MPPQRQFLKLKARLLMLTLCLVAAAGAPPWPLQSAEASEPAMGPVKMGQPLQLKFKALDGRDVDLSQLKGKVVLVDFWATWCGPCLRDLPALKAAYEKWRDHGFEIVGVNFDKRKEALNYVLKKDELPWPHYFDGRGMENRLGEKAGIESIPAMWLVDRQGRLRDLDARAGWAGKVEKLLAEK